MTSRCTSCHGTPLSGSAPFALASYADFAKDSPGYPGTTVAQRSLTRMQQATAPMPPTPAAKADPAELAAFEAWVNAGLPKGSCTVATGGDGRAVALTCASGAKWTGGNRESPLMNPGLACRACHLTEEPAKAYAFMGTVFPGLHEQDLCNATALPGDTVVEILDSTGALKLSMKPNAVGNFYVEQLSAGFTLPYRARVRANGKTSEMMAAQSDGDCNGCHTAVGANGAPGRIVAP